MRLTIKDAYKSLPYKHMPKHDFHIGSLTEFNRICRTVLEVLSEQLITTGKRYKLPCRLGDIQLVKFKPKKRAIDFYNTRKYGKTIYHKHMATNGYAVRLHWYKLGEANFRHKNIWALRLTTANKKGPDSVSNFIKKNGVKHYIEIRSLDFTKIAG